MFGLFSGDENSTRQTGRVTYCFHSPFSFDTCVDESASVKGKPCLINFVLIRIRVKCLFSIVIVGNVVAQWLVHRTWKVESSSPGRFTHVVFLGKTLTVSLPTKLYKWEPENCFGNNLTKCWEVTCDGLVSHPRGVEKLLVASYYTNLQWTSIPSKGSRNTPSRFILQKPEISADAPCNLGKFINFRFGPVSSERVK